MDVAPNDPHPGKPLGPRLTGTVDHSSLLI